MKTRAARIIAGAALAVAAAGSLLGAAEVVFAPSATVSRDRIFLQDIAKIQTSDPVEREKLDRFEVGWAPQPGLSQTVAVDRVVRMIETQAGIAVAASGAARVVVQRTEGKLELEGLWHALRSWLAAQWRVAAEDIKVLEVRLPANVRPPAEGQRFEFHALGDGLDVSCAIVVGDFRKELRLRLRFEVEAVVAVAANPIPLGKRVSLDDVRFEKRSVATPPWDYVRLPEQLGFLSTRAVIRPGEPIRLGNLRAERVIRRGDPVTIAYLGPRVSVNAPGKAMQSGKVGDFIQVRNTGSGRVITARVVSPQEVRVEH